MLPGECKGLNGTVCSDCGKVLSLKICHSNAGYYIGYWCDECGPYSRESEYFKTWDDALKAIESESKEWRRS